MTRSQSTPPAPEFYVAEQPLAVSGEGWSLSYQPGDQVPAEHVERFGWQHQVREPTVPPAPGTPQEE